MVKAANPNLSGSHVESGVAQEKVLQMNKPAVQQKNLENENICPTNHGAQVSNIKSKEAGLAVFRDAISGFSNINQNNVGTFGNLESVKMELEILERKGSNIAVEERGFGQDNTNTVVNERRA